MDEMLKKQDVLDAIYATMEKTDKPDVVLGLAAAMSTVKQMQAAPVMPAEKQEPCTDAISRQAVLDAIDKWVKSMHVLIALPANEVTPLFENVRELPPVNPAEKEEPCEDAISRQAVLEVIKKCHCEEWVKADIGAPIEALQPVTPAEKVGQWEWNQYDGNPKIGNFHCSQCHGIGKTYYDYCPYCGAKMASPTGAEGSDKE